MENGLKKRNGLLITEKVIQIICKGLRMISVGTIFMLMILIGADVITRYIWGGSVKGAVEISEMMLIVIGFTGMAYTQMKKRQAKVEILISLLSPFKQNILAAIAAMLSTFIFLLIGWSISKHAINIVLSTKPAPVTQILSIPNSPFILLAGISCFTLSLVLFLELVNSIKNIVRERRNNNKIKANF